MIVLSVLKITLRIVLGRIALGCSTATIRKGPVMWNYRFSKSCYSKVNTDSSEVRQRRSGSPLTTTFPSTTIRFLLLIPTLALYLYRQVEPRCTSVFI